MGYFKRWGGCLNWTRDSFLPALCKHTTQSLLILLVSSFDCPYQGSCTLDLCRFTKTGGWWSSLLGELKGLDSRRLRLRWILRDLAVGRLTSRTGALHLFHGLNTPVISYLLHYKNEHGKHTLKWANIRSHMYQDLKQAACLWMLLQVCSATIFDTEELWRPGAGENGPGETHLSAHIVDTMFL